MTPAILARDSVRDVSPIALGYDESDQRYVLVTEVGGLEVTIPFVAVDASARNQIHLLRRRELGPHASGTILEGSFEEYGAVGDQLRQIADGEHPEVASHAH